MDGFSLTMDWLWPAALGVIPLSLIAWGVGRWGVCRASTRHMMWVTVLLCFFVPPVIPAGTLFHGGETRDGTPSAPPAEQRSPAAAVPDHAPAPSARPGVRDRSVARGAVPPIGSTRRDANHGPATSPAPGAPPLAALTHQPLIVQRPEQPPAHAWTGVERNLQASGGIAPPMSVQTPTQGPERSRTASTSAAPTRQEVVPTPAATTAAAAPLAGGPSSPVPGWLDAPIAWAGGVVDSWTAQVRAWAAWMPRVADIRESVAKLPPVPGVVWFGGAGLLALVVVVRAVSLRRLLASAHPAPPSVRRAVESAARAIGLRQAPEILMVHDRVSPTVVCWGRPRLVLPYELWEELDEQGRDAVVLHELAHLRRRDHWVCWAELAASALFWWHPVMWWARQKVREEADACCDAWVTMLLPRGRRSYAQALLNTRAYLSQSGRAIPGVGLGVMNDSAERFARRLTMVMKERARPRLTACGAALAITLGLVGAASTPLWACPPEKTEQAEKQAAEATAKAREEVKAATAAARKDQERARKAQAEARAEADMAREKAMAQAEAQRERAMAQAQAQREKSMAQAQAQREKSMAQAARQRDRAVAQAQAQREKAMAEAAQAQAHAQQHDAAAAGAAPRAAARSLTSGRSPDGADSRVRQLEQRLERLEQQLQRLEELLSRRGPRTMAPGTPAPGALALDTPAPPAPPAYDLPPSAPTAPAPALAPAPPPAPVAPPPAAPGLPTPLPPGYGGISQATPATTNLFYSVTQPPATWPMVSALAGYRQPDETVEGRTYNLSGGKLEALVELMRRDDVPIFVSWSDDSITVNATPSQHRVFAAFVKMIHPEADVPGEAPAVESFPGAVWLNPAVEAAEADVAALSGLLGQLTTRVEVTAARAAELSIRADELEAEADALSDQADALAQEADELEGDAAEKLNAKVEAMREKADELRAKADEFRSESEAAESECEALEEELEAVHESATDGDDCDECCDNGECSGCAEGCEGECCDESEVSDAPAAPAPAPIRQ